MKTKETKEKGKLYVIAVRGTGTGRAAQTLVVYPALKICRVELCRDLL